MIVTLSAFQIYPAVNGGYDTDNLTVRWWYNRGFIDSTTVSVQGGNGQQGFYISSACTVDGSGIITVPSTNIFSTLDAIDPSPQSIQFFGRLYSGNTPKQWVTAFSSTPTGWVVQDSTPLTYEDLVLQNQAIVLANPPDVFPTFAQMIAYIDSLVPAPLASDTVFGRTKLSLAPVSSINPIAVGNNDPRLGSFVNVITYGAVGDDSTNNVTAFTNAQTAAALTGAALYIPVGTFRLTNGFAFTSPVMFAPGASIVKHAGGSISFAKEITADASQHFASTTTISVTFGSSAPLGLIHPEWWGAIPNGTTDCTTAIQSAITAATSRSAVQLSSGLYRITDSLTATGITSLTIQGINNFTSRIINEAAANKPTLVFTSKQYFNLRDFGIIGKIANPNDAIKLIGTAVVPTAFGNLSNIYLCPNGIGIHLINTVTLQITNCQYVPSGFANGGSGTQALLTNAILANVPNLSGTVTTNGTTTLTGSGTTFLTDFDPGDTIYVEGESSRVVATVPSDTSLTVLTTPFSTSASGLTYRPEGFNNDVHISGLNATGYATIADGGAGIKWDTPGLGNSQNVTIVGCELEGADRRSIDLEGVFSATIANNYIDNTNVRILRSRQVDVIADYTGSTTTYTVGDSTALNACLNVIVQFASGGSMSVDSQSSGCGAITCNFDQSPGYVNDGANPLTINVGSTAGLVADQLGSIGIKERGRTISLGQFTTPTFSAGNFTSPTGAWTLASGDVTTYEYQVVGTTMTVNFRLVTTTVTGTPAALQIAIPGGYTSTARVSSVFIGNSNGGAYFTSEMEVTSGGTTIVLYPALNAVGTWAAGTDNTNVRGSFSFEVS